MGGFERTFTLQVNPQGWQIDVQPGETLWRAAKRAGVRLPSSCLNGTCRTCMCKLEQGQVAYVIEWPGLSADEKAEGWVLPCVACAASDLVVHAPGAQEGERPAEG